MKEQILEEYDKKFRLTISCFSSNAEEITDNIKQFFSQAIDQTREEILEEFDKLEGLTFGSKEDKRESYKQFISDLRKRDMEALIGEFNKTHFVGDVKADVVRYTSELIKKIIKDYYYK